MILTIKAILMKMRSEWNQNGSNELLILWLSTELPISLMMEKEHHGQDWIFTKPHFEKSTK